MVACSEEACSKACDSARPPQSFAPPPPVGGRGGDGRAKAACEILVASCKACPYCSQAPRM
ncbi:hypothetical protein Scep_010286 [Stephania cephalantha]|uniref:Uncharacterized protein n=1 Tax=Stephania cephalantha TaxID=152367 RepID=A0AAP0PGX5_9MAGN